jgi:WD40-like Beta Propeller Repeat
MRSLLLLAGAALLAIGTGAAGSSPDAAPSRSRWVPTDLDNLGQARVEVADVNDRGRVLGGGNGDWIAYSTVPGDSLWRRGGPGYLTGSDVFVVRQGRQPMLVAGRGDGNTWNVCPAFSPDGTKLAFGTKSPAGLSVSVVRITRSGVSAARRVHLRVTGSVHAPCPQWSTDSTRLAYLRGAKVVVRGLDGSTRQAGVGDPVFRGTHADSLTSPTGDLVARRVDFACGVVVERPDGSGRRVVDVDPVGLTVCPYAVAAWSPDGRRLLVMFDVSGLHFTMVSVSVTAPFEQVPVVEMVRVNHPRSWPGRHDVSWQPRPTKRQ